MSNPAGYSRLQISLHWIVMVLLILQFVLHDAISDAWSQFLKGNEIAFSPLVASHVIIGFAILLLVLWRLFLRMRRGVPALPENESPLQQFIAKAVHVLLYVVLLLLPVSGAAAWFGEVKIAAEGHEIMKALLLLLVGLHVLGALVNQYVLKNGLIGRMMKSG